MKESELQKQILFILNSDPKCKAVAVTVGPFGRKGEPDIMGSYGGRMFVIEVKLPGKELTKIQEKRIVEWKQAGALAGVCNSLESVRMFIDHLREICFEKES